MRDERRLYGDLAWTWPIISPPEEYAGEAEESRSAIDRHAPAARTLLRRRCSPPCARRRSQNGTFKPLPRIRA